MAYNVYKYEGPGHYLGCAVVVMAEDENRAIHLINEELAANGVERGCNSFNIVKVERNKEQVIYLDNGDY